MPFPNLLDTIVKGFRAFMRCSQTCLSKALVSAAAGSCYPIAMLLLQVRVAVTCYHNRMHYTHAHTHTFSIIII
jgi:hypothetical protein